MPAEARMPEHSTPKLVRRKAWLVKLGMVMVGI